MKWHEIAHTFAVVDYEGEITEKISSKYCKYSSVKHLLFMFYDFAGMMVDHSVLSKLKRKKDKKLVKSVIVEKKHIFRFKSTDVQ